MDDSSLFFTTDAYPTMAYNATEKQALLDVFYMHHEFKGNGTKDSRKPRASECILYFCVQEYSAKVVAGAYSEHVLSSWPGPQTPVPDAPDLSAAPGNPPKSPFSIDLTLQPPGQDQKYTVDARSFSLLKEWIGDMIGDTGFTGDTGISNAVDAAQAMYAIQKAAKNDESGPERVMTTVAGGLSAAVRGIGNHSTAVTGTSLREEPYVKARWWWAILPIGLVVLTCFFMAVTLIITARHGVPIWKSSALATLAHGLNESSSGSITADRLDIIENKAGRHQMSMTAQQEQWRLQSTKA